MFDILATFYHMYQMKAHMVNCAPAEMITTFSECQHAAKKLGKRPPQVLGDKDKGTTSAYVGGCYGLQTQGYTYFNANTDLAIDDRYKNNNYYYNEKKKEITSIANA